jgi:predicted dehydrogenase
LACSSATSNVISDLAVHDFSILDYLLAEHPVAVSASGTNHFQGTPENLAYITLFLRFGDHRPYQR